MSFLKGGILGELESILGKEFVTGLTFEEIEALSFAPEIGIPLLIGTLAITASQSSRIQDLTARARTGNVPTQEQYDTLKNGAKRINPNAPRHFTSDNPRPIIRRPIVRGPVTDDPGDGGPVNNKPRESDPLIPTPPKSRVDRIRHAVRKRMGLIPIEAAPESSGLGSAGDFSGGGGIEMQPAGTSTVTMTEEKSARDVPEFDDSGESEDFQDVELGEPTLRQRRGTPAESDPLLQSDPEERKDRTIRTPEEEGNMAHGIVTALIGAGIGMAGLIKAIIDALRITQEDAENIIKDIIGGNPDTKKKIDENNRQENIDNRVSKILNQGKSGLPTIDMKQYRLPSTKKSYNHVELIQRANMNYRRSVNFY